MNKNIILNLALAISILLSSFSIADDSSVSQDGLNPLIGKQVSAITIRKDDIILGNANSDIIIIAYYSTICPHCANYNKHLFPDFKKEYIDTNKIAYVIRENVGNKQDFYAASLMRCKGTQESYLKFRDVLLAQQASWGYTKKFEEILTNIGQLGGISPEEYATCIDNQDLKKIMITNSKELAMTQPGQKYLNLPMYIAEGFGSSDVYKLKKFIDSKLSKKKTTDKK